MNTRLQIIALAALTQLHQERRVIYDCAPLLRRPIAAQDLHDHGEATH
jgi:hypothetical protein